MNSCSLILNSSGDVALADDAAEITPNLYSLDLTTYIGLMDETLLNCSTFSHFLLMYIFI